MRFEEVFGIKIAIGRRCELLEAAKKKLKDGGIITTVNPEILSRARQDQELHSVIASSLAIPDGVGVSMLFSDGSERLPGIELAEELLEVMPIKLAIIGGREGVAECAMERLVEKHKNIIPEFCADGYSFSVNNIKERIRAKSPDLVFICLGSPKQEILARELYLDFPSALYIGLGGSADIWSGEKKRAPRIFRAFGLEWLYRAVREPRRILRLGNSVSFVVKSVIYRLNQQKNGTKEPKSY